MKSNMSILVLIAVFLSLLPIIPAGKAYAAMSINLDNYYAVRTTSTGEHYLMDKYYNPTVYGDSTQNDAIVKGYRFVATGLGSGDKLYIDYDNGSSQQINAGTTYEVTQTTKSITARLVKSSSGETYVKMTTFRVYDDDAADYIDYTYTADLEGSSDIDLVTKVNATYYYAPYKDEYRVDYAPPAGATKYELYYEAANGTPYNAVYNNTPTGIHYLTCNGTYWLKFYDSSGKLFAKTDAMTTSAIQLPSCNSYLEGNAGSSDIDLTVTANNDPISGQKRVNVTFTEIAGADNYEIWIDGKKFTDIAADTKPLGTTLYTDGKSLTVIAKDANGETLGQSDAIIPNVQAEEPTTEGCDGCSWLNQVLACPAWDDYMGEWSDMLNNVFDASHYQMVAGIMRDTIVPAMGQEIVNRMPELSKILADELQSREKQVVPPSAPPPNYQAPETQPTLTDLPNKIETDITSNVPNFEPDYTGSESFAIPDPITDIQLDDEDAGYGYPDETDNSNPAYDHKETESAPPLKYNYNWHNVPESGPPTYQATTSDSSSPIYQTEDSGAMPDYNLNANGVIPTYNVEKGGIK